MKTKTVMSKCHLYTGAWVPEVNSPLEWVSRHYHGRPSKRKHLKQHWSGARTCSFVKHGKDNAYDRQHIHQGAAFRELPGAMRCRDCQEDMMNP
jgi:hypothetical protein